MGRLVGFGGALIVIAVAGLFLGFGAFFVEESGGSNLEEGGNRSFDVTAVTVEPACLWPVLDASFSPDAPEAPSQVSLQDCVPADAETIVDGDWNRVSLHRGELADADFERRFSGARVAHLSDEGWIALEAYDNWGGSGVFSSLVTGRIAAEGAELRDIKVHAFGDRCNGGLVGTGMAPDGRLLASANMTPWDILLIPLADLSFEAQWKGAQERFGEVAGLAPSCASCCSAVTHEYEVGFTGDLLSQGFRYNSTMAENSSADSLTLCLEQSVETVAGKDGLVGAEEQADLSPLIDACAEEAMN